MPFETPGESSVDADRAIRVATAIGDLAQAEGVPAAVRHVCVACAAMVGATGVGASVISHLGLVEPLAATSSASEWVMDLQATLGEGPSTVALAENRPVLIPDLSSDVCMRRWPAFAPAAVTAGTLAVFAFPLVLGAISMGVLEIHRADAGSLTAAELVDAWLFTDAAMIQVIDQLSRPSSGSLPASDGDLEYRWAEVHQATGVVSVQLDTTLADALLRLRAHAYLTGRRLSEVAHAVLTGALRLASGTDDHDQG
jgi:hypothetical protein